MLLRSGCKTRRRSLHHHRHRRRLRRLRIGGRRKREFFLGCEDDRYDSASNYASTTVFVLQIVSRDARASALAFLSVADLFRVSRGILVRMKDFFVEDAARFENTTVTTYFVLSSMQVRDKKQGGQYLALIVVIRLGRLRRGCGTT